MYIKPSPSFARCSWNSIWPVKNSFCHCTLLVTTISVQRHKQPLWAVTDYTRHDSLRRLLRAGIPVLCLAHWPVVKHRRHLPALNHRSAGDWHSLVSSAADGWQELPPSTGTCIFAVQNGCLPGYRLPCTKKGKVNAELRLRKTNIPFPTPPLLPAPQSLCGKIALCNKYITTICSRQGFSFSLSTKPPLVSI